ncbi:MAG: Nif3-like dinuclear metal center hexameric protein [Candidatus Hydrogenedens sp.]|jgi:dinuclear metal center YbgI/SA1388 family protein|nr:Nif3-like dinuclear metal center hexameric protein [Candidatus Hydrogenedens sp.]
MSYKVKDICNFMEEWAPEKLAADWDNVGLQTGDPVQEVNAVLTCLSVTPEALEEAKDMGANMIVAHHPLIFRPIKTLREDYPHARLCAEILRNRIACFVAHTNLDITEGGVNDILATKLGLTKIKPLFRDDSQRQFKLITFVPKDHVDRLRDALALAGAGVIGDYSHCSFQSEGMGSFQPLEAAKPFSGEKGQLNLEPEIRLEMIVPAATSAKILQALMNHHPYEEPAYDLIALENPNRRIGLGRQGILEEPMSLAVFGKKVRDALCLPHLVYYGQGEKKVRKVALLGGSGGKMVGKLPENTDVYVSGDVGYHDAETAQLRDIACIDAGHWGTEQPVVMEMKERLQEAFPQITVSAFLETAPGIRL